MGLMHKSILITGINGFLGYNLALKLKDYYKIIGIDVNTSKYNNFNYNTLYKTQKTLVIPLPYPAIVRITIPNVHLQYFSFP